MLRAMSSSSRAPAINPDGSLVKFPAPAPASPASVAAAAGDVQALEGLAPPSLLEADAGSGNTPLIWAADGGHLPAVSYLLSLSPANVDSPGFIGNSALCRASRGGHLPTVSALLAAGADPNLPNDKKQYPLHFAAFKKHPEVVRALLDCGRCDLSVTDRKGRTPDMDTSDGAIRDMIRAEMK